MKNIDIFAHVLPPRFYERMLKVEPSLPQRFPFIQHPLLQDMEARRDKWDGVTQQVISAVNVNPEDYVEPEEAAALCRVCNTELAQMVDQESDMFAAAVAMVPLNHIPATLTIMEELAQDPHFLGIQLFTRHLGKSLADPDFDPVFQAAERLGLGIWLHPVFDERKPDNNIVFSWEYELSQTMLELVQADLFQKYPDLVVLVHHAGAMAPYFAGRIDHVLREQESSDMRKFYVDTALLGNPKALDLTVDFYGADRVLLGTDAPLGIAPTGATMEILEAISDIDLSASDREKILSVNARELFSKLEGIES